jgi:hypothetical protein
MLISPLALIGMLISLFLVGVLYGVAYMAGNRSLPAACQRRRGRLHQRLPKDG